MFDSLVVLRKERSVARLAWSLPVSVAFHATAAALLVLYSVFGPVSLVPPCDVFLCAPELVVPVQLGGPGGESPKAEEPPRARASVPEASRLVEPDSEEDSENPPGFLDRQEFSANQGLPGAGPGGLGDPFGEVGGLPPEGPDTNAQPERSPERVLVKELGKVSALRALSEGPPTYPHALASLRLAGRVELEVVVDESGRVESVTVLSATHPLFAEAAVAAVQNWRYAPPVSAAGARVAVMRRVVVNFSPR